MHRALKRPLPGSLILYAAFFLQAFLAGAFPQGVVRPELDLIVLGWYAFKVGPVAALLLGFWNGLLRDSMTQGPTGGWTVCLMLLALGLSYLKRLRRLGVVQRSFFLSGAFLLAEAVLFLPRAVASQGWNPAFVFFIRLLLPSVVLTGIFYFLMGWMLNRWNSHLEPMPTDG